LAVVEIDQKGEKMEKADKNERPFQESDPANERMRERLEDEAFGWLERQYERERIETDHMTEDEYWAWVRRETGK